MRNKQYGQKTLSLLAKQGKTLILEIDPPKDDISKRRKGFYERCGFTENFFTHIHPPYHKEEVFTILYFLETHSQTVQGNCLPLRVPILLQHSCYSTK